MHLVVWDTLTNNVSIIGFWCGWTGYFGEFLARRHALGTPKIKQQSLRFVRSIRTIPRPLPKSDVLVAFLLSGAHTVVCFPLVSSARRRSCPLRYAFLQLKRALKSRSVSLTERFFPKDCQHAFFVSYLLFQVWPSNGTALYRPKKWEFPPQNSGLDLSGRLPANFRPFCLVRFLFTPFCVRVDGPDHVIDYFRVKVNQQPKKSEKSHCTSFLHNRLKVCRSMTNTNIIVITTD